MKIAVVGAGAMGSVYAGLLADAGNEVWAVDVWKDHVDAINERGLRVEGASGDRTVRVKATRTAADIGPCELVIIATKAAQVGEAAKSIEPMVVDDTLILTIQNGLGAAERICQYRDPDNILIGVAGGFGAAMKGPGHVHHNGMELIRLGEMRGPVSERLEKIAQLWRDAGFNVKTFDDIEQLVWEKFLCNVTFSGTCTILRRTIGEVLTDENAWKVGLACGLEAHAAGVAKGVKFSFDDPKAYIHDFGSKIPGARPSMLLDHLAGRRSEIDAINGMVPVVAREVGVPSPTNETIVALVKALERDFD
ncbi:MAG TPA: 2-dehydropantoate 2-reductase [Gammaproteobacteria bacterium]|nr:2-dehydropantoate 2-reductase [Gammaproteobacteria bacterium]